MDPIVGGLIGAGTKLLGGLFGKGPSIGSQVHSQIDAKMEDAKKYGISPLAMLGMQTQVSAPQGVNMGDVVSGMGQDISRAVSARQTTGDRIATSLALENAKLQNDFLRAQINRVNADILQRTAGPAKPVRLSPEGLPENTKNFNVQKPSFTPNMQIGLPYKTNPNFVDADAWEQRYGDSEIGSMLAGMINAGADIYYNFPPMPNGSQAKAARLLDAILSQESWNPYDPRYYKRSLPRIR